MFNMFKKKSIVPPKKSDHDLLMDEMFDSKTRKDQYKSIFKYDSINQYKSIHSYGEFKGKHEVTVDHYTKPGGFEILVNYGIIGFFYFLLVVLLPFSLFVCLKKVNQNERMIIYRLGRIVSPEQKPGYCICFPIIDDYKKISTSQKEFSVPNLQILNEENTIIDTTTIVRYEVFDPIKLLNNLEDQNNTLKSVARGYLVNIISKKDSGKVEKEKSYIIQEFTNQMNNNIKRWGLKITNVDLKINSIQLDPNDDGGDPALKTISMVFKSLLGGGSSSSSSSEPSKPKIDTSMENLPNELMKFIEGLSQPMVLQGGDMGANPFAGLLGGMMPGMMPSTSKSTNHTSPEAVTIDMETGSMASGSDGKMSPYTILKLLEPLMNESLVKEIQCVYEFHISSTTNRGAVEIFYLDLKNLNKGKLGPGRSPFAEKTDCVIRLNDEDLHELLTDNLKPFTAYMSGRIEIDGDLQDVFKLKKLISSVSAVIASMNNK